MEDTTNCRSLYAINRSDNSIATNGTCGRCTGEAFVVFNNNITLITWCNNCGRLVLLDINTGRSDRYVPTMSDHLPR